MTLLSVFFSRYSLVAIYIYFLPLSCTVFQCKREYYTSKNLLKYVSFKSFKVRKLKQFIFISLKGRVRFIVKDRFFFKLRIFSFLLFGYLNLHNPLISLFTHYVFWHLKQVNVFQGFLMFLKYQKVCFLK